MARLSKLVLEHIIIPSNHTISFVNNAARDAWFDARPNQTFDDLTHIRKEGIEIESLIDNIRQYNCGYYLNEVGERVYFRITDMRYKNENNTLITIEIDVLMTYLPSATMQPSFIERSNDVPSSVFDSDVPELQYGGGYTHSLLDTFATSNDFAFFMQLSGDFEPDAQKRALTNYSPKNFNNSFIETISFASMFRIFTALPPYNEFEAVLADYMTAGTGDRILSAGAIPYDDIDYSQVIDDGKMVANVDSVRQTKTISISTSINTRIAKDNVTVVIAERGNFGNSIEIPISELSSGSLTLVSVSDPISQQRHIAVIDGADGDNELKYRITINTGVSLPSLNLPYYMAARNIETDLSAQQTNNVVGGVSSALSGAIGGAALGAIGGPVGAVAGAIGGASGAILSTATNAVQNQVSASAALEKAKRLAPTVSGVPTGFGIFANQSVGVNIFIKEPSGSGLQQLTDYYRFFGYNKSRVLTPNVKTGTHFYVGNVNGNYPKASATEAAIIRSLFNSGVWIWEDEASFFSY